GDLAGARQLGARDRDGADDRVAAAAVALADLVDLVRPRNLRPGVRPDRDLRARRQRHPDRVARLGEQVVRDELVERRRLLIGEVEENALALLPRLRADGLYC